MTAGRTEPPCRCGHPHDAHQHYRAGTDCALCPCTHYLPESPMDKCPLCEGINPENCSRCRG